MQLPLLMQSCMAYLIRFCTERTWFNFAWIIMSLWNEKFPIGFPFFVGGNKNVENQFIEQVRWEWTSKYIKGVFRDSSCSSWFWFRIVDCEKAYRIVPSGTFVLSCLEGKKLQRLGSARIFDKWNASFIHQKLCRSKLFPYSNQLFGFVQHYWTRVFFLHHSGLWCKHKFRISYFSSANLKKLSGYQRYQQASPTCKISDRLVWNCGKFKIDIR